MATLSREQVVCIPVYNIADVFEDPHCRACGNILEAEDPRTGSLKMQEVVPKLSPTSG